MAKKVGYCRFKYTITYMHFLTLYRIHCLIKQHMVLEVLCCLTPEVG